MNDNILIIEPQKGLGFFKLEANVNYIISEIRARGERYEHSDIVVGENINEPIYVLLKKEGIKFRFDQNYQRLELIEIDVKIKERSHDIVYKNLLILQGINSYINNSNNSQIKNSYRVKSIHSLTYNYINSVFGPSHVPKIIDNNKFILLRYDGISFLFETFNQNVELNEDYITQNGSEFLLSKISIFSDKFLIDSISKDNNLFRNPQPVIIVEIDKGIYIIQPHLEDEKNLIKNDISITFDESLQNVLSKLKNPNFIYYKKNENNEINDYDSDSSLPHFKSNREYNYNEDSDFILNYYSLGLDILIDANKLKVKKFILHTNNPFDLKFGIYNKSNFIVEMNKNFIKKLEIINEVNNKNDRESMNFGNNMNIPSSRKVSEDCYSIHKNQFISEDGNLSMNLSITENNNINSNENFKIEKTENMQYSNSKSDREKDNLGYQDTYTLNTVNKEENNSNLIYNSNTQNYSKRKRTDYKLSIESRDNLNIVEKSFCSMNESNLSISLNTSDIFINLIINPNINFNEVLNRIPPHSYVIYHRHEAKLNIVTKYYSFDGIIFEVLDNFSIASITLTQPIIKDK